MERIIQLGIPWKQLSHPLEKEPTSIANNPLKLRPVNPSSSFLLTNYPRTRT